MAFEVARAYDENKNLVPLYILTDGEVPEVSPGFDFTVNSSNETTFTVYVVNESTNPTGGVVTVIMDEDSIRIDNDASGTFTVYNHSIFTISVSLSVVRKSGSASGGLSDITVTSGNPSTITPNQSAVYNFRSSYLQFVTYLYSVTLNIQRIRT